MKPSMTIMTQAFVKVAIQDAHQVQIHVQSAINNDSIDNGSTSRTPNWKPQIIK